MIKKDPRYAEKPKFPMSPYFLFLSEMRSKASLNPPAQPLPNKQFTEQVGKNWR